jgi:hypothetical protein
MEVFSKVAKMKIGEHFRENFKRRNVASVLTVRGQVTKWDLLLTKPRNLLGTGCMVTLVLWQDGSFHVVCQGKTV